MDKKSKKTIIANLTKEIGKLEKDEFTFFFFVIDTKGTPNGSVAYTYETAMMLTEKGYKVKMIHGEKEFVGVRGWLGEDYASLPHYNIETDGVTISPSDFLIIPEIYSNVMYKTFEKKLPCKRIALLTNFNYLTEIIQPGASWGDYGIHDCIVATEALGKRLNEVFPNVSTKVVRPCISKVFESTNDAKKLIINVVTSNKSDVNKIVKPFFWKYPMYKWVGFRDVRNLSREQFAEALNEAFATVWVDTDTDFGYSAVEAMAADNLVVGKIPENAPEWMIKDNAIKDNGVWFYNTDSVHDIIANIVQSFIHNNIPSKIYETAKETYEYYSQENFANDVVSVYINHYKKKRVEELTEALTLIKNNTEEE